VCCKTLESGVQKNVFHMFFIKMGMSYERSGLLMDFELIYRDSFLSVGLDSTHL